MKKRTRVTACLMAGVLILSVSAFAAFDSVSGYAQYKTAAKALLLQTDNVTMQGAAYVKSDGKEITAYEVELQKDGENLYTHSNERYISGENWERYEEYQGSVNRWYNVGDTENEKPIYYENRNSTPISGNIMDVDMSDETASRMAAFTEIAADTVVGDLKNNFVQVGSENGVDTYRVDIDENQVPALVSAGLSLLACLQAEDSGSSILYDKGWSEMCVTYYEKATGEALPAQFRDAMVGDSWSDSWYEENEALFDKVMTKGNELDEIGSKVLEQHDGNGIVYLYGDGSYDYYADRGALVTAHPEQVDVEDAVGSEMTLKRVTCEFSVDEAGNLVSNTGEAVFYTNGTDGKGHELSVSFRLDCSDYGTTQVQQLDTAGLTKVDVTGE